MKLLIEIPTWLGDAAMATPAIENIANYYNEPEIILIGSIASVEALKNNPKVAETHILDKKYINLYKLAKKLGEFDVYFSFRSSFRAKLFKFLISSKNKYQFNKFKHRNLHQVEKYNNFVNGSLNTNFSAGKISIYRDISVINTNNSKLTLGINPGASYGSAKRWYPKEFAEVATALSSKYEVIIFGLQKVKIKEFDNKFLYREADLSMIKDKLIISDEDKLRRRLISKFTDLIGISRQNIDLEFINSNISSSEIRHLLSKKLPIKNLLPLKVEQYIITHHLYQKFYQS